MQSVVEEKKKVCCPFCNTELLGDEKKCPGCSKELKYCTHCGSLLNEKGQCPEDGVFCSSCGHELPVPGLGCGHPGNTSICPSCQGGRS